MATKKSASATDKPKTRKAPPRKAKPKPKTKSKTKSSAKASGTPKRASIFRRLVRTSFMLLLFLVIAGGVAVAGIFYIYSLDLPSILERDDFKPKQMTRIYSSEGHVIDELIAADGRRTVVPFEHIAKPMRDAILAAEDADFYQHQGLDYYGMVRALYYAVRYNKRQGASTITQQVVKNLVLTPEKTIKRKIQEIMLARELEDNLSKDDILYIYLNQIYFGHGNYGIQEAARFYFGKSAKDLGVAESATLAGLVQSPERYSVRRHPERAEARKLYVLDQMLKKGMIEQATYNAAVAEKLEVVNDSRTTDPYLNAAPYYTAHVNRLLKERFPNKEVPAMGLNVKTGLVIANQVEAERAVRLGLSAFENKNGNTHGPRERLKPKEVENHHKRAARKLEKTGLVPGAIYEAVVTRVVPGALHVRYGDRSGKLRVERGSRANPKGEPLDKIFKPNHTVRVMVDTAWPAGAKEVVFVEPPGVQGALVSIDVKTRVVEAMVGGYDFKTSSFNRATQARRQTGSSFKPFVYSAAINDHHSTPATIWLDAPKPFSIEGGKVWSPRNSDGKYLGSLRMRRALALSRNVVAVRLLEKVGIDRTQQWARLAGVEGPLVDNYTMALGSSELTVLEMTNAYTTFAASGKRGAAIFITSVDDSFSQELIRADTTLEQTIPPEVAYLTVDMMKSVLSRGTASRIGRGLGRPAAGKTGTTNKSRDAWFIGFTPQKATGVWVGYDDNKPLGRGSSGGTTAAPIWLAYMKTIHKKIPAEDFKKPAVGIVEARIDSTTGLLAREGQKGTLNEVFLTGTAPTEYAPEDGESSEGDFLLEQGEEAAMGEAEE